MTHIQKIDEMHRTMKDRYNAVSLKMSLYDSLEQKILHYIELENYSASDGAKLLKKLKLIRIGRRNIKYEYAELMSILSRFENAKFNELKEPNQNLYAVSLDEILNAEL